MGVNDFDVGFTGFPAPAYASGNAAGNPSGYGTKMKAGMRNELIVGVVIIAVLFMLIAGVVMLRVSGEVVI